ncbi:MAG: hypothetical protein JW765_01025 [Deltaproteobacteria bacterium]|nr:hypothetical protein [Candidatus Zymogenaceae bacterium]
MRRVRIISIMAVVSIAGVVMFFRPAPAADVLAEANKSLALTAETLIAAKGEPRTFTYGPIVDDANNRGVFRVVALIADLTGLDFVSLAIIQYHGGDITLFAAVSNLPNALAGKSDALKILARRQLIYLQRPYYEDYFRDLSRDDPVAYANAVAAEVWEAFKAEYGDLSSTDPSLLKDKYPECSDISEIIGVDLVPIAGIRAVGGISGINEFLILMPDTLSGKDEAIQALSKVKKK